MYKQIKYQHPAVKKAPRDVLRFQSEEGIFIVLIVSHPNLEAWPPKKEQPQSTILYKTLSKTIILHNIIFQIPKDKLSTVSILGFGFVYPFRSM